MKAEFIKINATEYNSVKYEDEIIINANHISSYSLGTNILKLKNRQDFKLEDEDSKNKILNFLYTHLINNQDTMEEIKIIREQIKEARRNIKQANRILNDIIKGQELKEIKKKKERQMGFIALNKTKEK